MKRLALIAMAALATMAQDCDDLSAPERQLLRDLDDAREQWADHGFSDYALTLRHDCFCGEEARGPVVVQVRFGEVAGRVYQESGQPVSGDYARFFPDVEGLFDFIESAIDQDAAEIRVEFHPELGYPTQIAVDFIENAADEERGYFVLAIESQP
jgi:hypothetical protein